MQQERIATNEVQLTDRERQVVTAIIEGCTDHMSIGKQLGISTRTAQTHCDNIRHKLNLPRFIHLIIQAREISTQFQEPKP